MSPSRRRDPWVSWSLGLLQGMPGVEGAFFLRQQGLLGEYLGIVVEDGQSHAVELRVRELLESSPRVVGHAQVPDLPCAFAMLGADATRFQWGIEERRTLRAGARLREAEVLFGSKLLRGPVTRSKQARRGLAPESLAESDCLFWIDAGMAGELLRHYQVGAAEVVLHRLEEHLWSWIDVRDMEKEMREGLFPRVPEPLRHRPAPDTAPTMTSYLREWITFYKQVRDRVLEEEGITLEGRAERVTSRFLRECFRDAAEG